MAADEHGSPSPQPHQPMTKRDVRRNRIMDKLEGIITTFTANQQHHYRAQLQAIQADMTLVLRADPYNTNGGAGRSGAGGLLEDGGDEIREKVMEMGAVLPNDEGAQKDYWAMAGSRYREFARQVNDSIEHRDADLVALHNNYESSVDELDRLTQQKLHQAEEEHKHLSNTIRQRLIASITKKRQQLLRDKEQLDIADTNALLLHPSHYSINNPGSPGGGVTNRKTRHLRHRAGSPNPGDIVDGGKRKRRFIANEEDGTDSVAPAFKPLPPPDALAGGRSPFKDARDKNSYIQYEAPAYSIERIFTDKELALATDSARNAMYRYFFQPQQKDDQATASNGVADTFLDGEAADGAAGDEAAATTETANGPSPPGQPAPVEMARETSHQVLTRGGARANPLAALSDLANAAASASAASGTGLERSDPFAPHIPTYHPVTRSEKIGAPAPPGINALDVESDFAMMRQTASHKLDAPDDTDEVMEDAATVEAASNMRRQLLDQALGTSSTSHPYRLPLLETGPAVIGKGVDRLATTAFAPALSMEQRLKIQQQQQSAMGAASMAAALQSRFGGEPMSRTTSAGGVSDIGVAATTAANAENNATSGGTGRRGRGRLV